jgi:serine/threonine protein phosphatase PrpC
VEDGAAFNPNFAAVPLPPGATLLLCSDGLWNYAETAEDLAKLAAAPDALAACRDLTAFANEAGGRDNISVAILTS